MRACVLVKDTGISREGGRMFEGRDSGDDDLMRDGQISGQIDGDRDRERDRLRGLEEQRWCSVAPGHDTLPIHTHSHTRFAW